MTRVYFNFYKAVMNRKADVPKPPFTVVHSNGRREHRFRVVVNGPCELVYDPEDSDQWFASVHLKTESQCNELP